MVNTLAGSCLTKIILIRSPEKSYNIIPTALSRMSDLMQHWDPNVKEATVDFFSKLLHHGKHTFQFAFAKISHENHQRNFIAPSQLLCPKFLNSCKMRIWMSDNQWSGFRQSLENMVSFAKLSFTGTIVVTG